MTSGMRVVPWDPADTAALRGCQAVWDAAQEIDDPDGPRMPERVMSGWLRLAREIRDPEWGKK